jgi:hypothetical protein
MINRAPRFVVGVYNWLDRKENYDGDFKLLFIKAQTQSDPRARTAHVIVSVYPVYAHLLNEIMGDSGVTSVNGSSSSRTRSRSTKSGMAARPTIFWSQTNKQRECCAAGVENKKSKRLVSGQSKFAALNCIPKPGRSNPNVLYMINAGKRIARNCAAGCCFTECESHRHRWTR